MDFFFRVGDGLHLLRGQRRLLPVLYTRTGLVGGWTLDQTYMFACGYLFVDAIHMTLFANNMWMLPVFINKGDLDYYLVRPVSSLFFLSLREFAANSF